MNLIGHGKTLTYKPYYYEKFTSRPNTLPGVETEEFNATAAEFSTLGLNDKQDLRIVLTDKNDKVVMNRNLIDFLYLLKIQGHLSEQMSFQEYLDREDHFSIALYVSGDTTTWLGTKVVINDWVINLIDIDF